MKYHGVLFEEDGEAGHLKFGALRLLETLSVAFRWPFTVERPDWPEKWFDRKFDQAVSQYRDTFFKFDRSAGHLFKCSEAIRSGHGHVQQGGPIELFAEFFQAIDDLPLYLDLLLIYLRIQADRLANVIPNLYGQRGRRESIARDSFRKQARWFKDRCPDFDPDYKAILESSLGWFDTLAGQRRGEGIRDILIHRRGTYQIGWTIADSENRFKLRPSLVADYGFACNDLVESLKAMTGGYFEYLDKMFSHYCNLLRTEIGSDFLQDLDAISNLYTFDRPGPSLWIYPVVQTGRAM